jgi:hypothetical protein
MRAMKKILAGCGLAILMSVLAATMTFAQAQQCVDGQDNDRDGLIDRNGTATVPPDPQCASRDALCEDGTFDCVRNPATTGGTSTQNPATTGGTSTTNTASEFPLQFRLENPLKVNTIEEAISLFMETVVKLAIPFIVVFFIWSGVNFILAQGNKTKLENAKKMFWNTVIGTLLILGAWAITDAIVGTVNSLGS